RGRKVWRLVSHRHKIALAGAALLMALVSACNTAIPLLLGRLVDDVQLHVQNGIDRDRLTSAAAFFLGLIAAAYVLREGLQVCRRNLVESTCTRVEKLMTIKLVSHLLKSELASLTQERIGSLH